MTELVRDLILTPMQQLYRVPPHLLRDPSALEQILATYERSLARFDQYALQHGWEQTVVRHTDWHWPSPGIIAQACQRFQVAAVAPSDETHHRERAITMTDDYTARFLKTSHVAKLAHVQGWAGHLREYVHAAAWVQAQLICGVRHLGWDCSLIPDWDRFDSVREAFTTYRQTIAKPVERKQIRVTVPKERIRDWQVRVQRMECPPPARG